ncbi:hypothetical protein EV193_106224 [Herbihabitans rhizosphaerae]|uniref:Uncharacterized protein n=1 Tax=Herbihabitans rhizosphaerae TaxID=1872711 RepID=A0A4Q7KKA7_9PSEU|nr:hypothetical protein [Herbihabitans rhizosphaerae]RZS36989.1 hypothetical protein EV193_106224 [Herbihabitans rhizosphaerae]
MTGDNPLVTKEKETDGDWYDERDEWQEGIGLIDSGRDIYDGLSNGDWVEAGVGVLGVGLEGLCLAIDPVGTLVSYGISWAIEHIQPLSDALDAVAGDPDAIQASSDTWHNIAERQLKIAEDYKTEVDTATADWTGDAADNYRTHAGKLIDLTTVSGVLSEAISISVMIMGEVVSVVRETIRDIIADVIAEILVIVAEEACTMGAATPLAISQLVALMVRVGKRLLTLFTTLGKTVMNLLPLMKKAVKLFDDVAAALKKLTKNKNKNDDFTPDKDTDIDDHKDTSDLDTNDPGGTDPSSTAPGDDKPADPPPGSSKPDGGSSPDGSGKPDGGTSPEGDRTKPGTSEDGRPSDDGDKPGGNKDEPHPPLSKQEQDALEQRRKDLEAQNKELFDELKKDPDHNKNDNANSKQEARTALDLEARGQDGFEPGQYQRPDGPGQGDFIDSNGKHWDIKGIHSDWPPGVPDHVKNSRPFPNAYTEADFRDTLVDQFGKGRGVIVDTRNADQAAIDNMRDVVEKEGWGDDVIWYP